MAKKDLEFQAPASLTRPAVPDVFATGVRGQETVALDLQFGGVECTAAEDMARQEYALSSDLKYQIQRFGVGQPGPSGYVDWDNMDLTRALELVDASQKAWLELPRVIRDRYRSWANVEAAAESGELEQLLKAAGAAGSGMPAAPAASASDSAPVEGAKPV